MMKVSIILILKKWILLIFTKSRFFTVKNINVGPGKYRGEERRKDEGGEITRFFRGKKKTTKKERVNRVMV